MKVLVTGATGYIGSRLLQTLQAAGHDVKVLVRNHSDLPEQICTQSVAYTSHAQITA